MFSRLINSLGQRTPKLIYQETETECGLACVAMLAYYYDKQVEMVSIRKKYRLSPSGLNMKDIAFILADLKLKPVAIKIDVDFLSKGGCPAIVHLKSNHFVVVQHRGGSAFSVYDPALGQSAKTAEELQKIISGAALIALPTDVFEKSALSEPLPIKYFIGCKKGFILTSTKILLITIILEVLINTLPMISQHIFDRAIPNNDLEALKNAALLFFLITAFWQVSAWIRSRLAEKFSLMVGESATINSFNHLINLPLSYFEQRRLGDIQSRFSAVNRLRNFLTGNITSLVLDSFFSLVVFVILFYYSISLALISILFFAIYISIRVISHRTQTVYTEKFERDHANMQVFFLESLRGIIGLKTLSSLPSRKAAWKGMVEKVSRDQLILANKEGDLSTISNFIAGSERACILFVGAGMVIKDSLTLGQLIAFLAYKEQLFWRINNLFGNISAFYLLRIGITRLKDILCADMELRPESARGENLLEQQIEIKNLYYSYSQFDKPVLSDLNLQITSGKHTVIVGPSGTGKSTLAKLILGLIKPDSGSITCAGWPMDCYSDSMAAVLQQDYLYSGTIKENITMFSSAVDYPLLDKCVEAAELKETVQSLKMSLDTQIGEIAHLSSGQTQRILIARALYKKPKLLVMDEATAHLDEDNEKKISANIAQLNITRISFSHRQHTIRSGDYVYNLGERGYI